MPIASQKTNDGVILVGWYTTDDPENPHNWSSLKRSYIVFVICLYTWVTYVAGSVFAFSEPGIVEHFGVSVEASELGLALYVLAYGVGPLVFGPLTEIPVIGRNPIRSNGKGLEMASLGSRVDLCSHGYILLALTPETSTPNVLLRRAKRLRKLTADSRLQSQSEIEQKHMTSSDVLIAALIRPFEITIKDPSIFFVNLYAALTYAIYFTFFEVFPLVFPPFYGFNLGETGLAFLACEVGSGVALILYFAYLHFYMIPDSKKNGFREQEHCLLPAIFGSFIIPIGLFTFAWTARASIH
ncbi:major facilitator superfamily transporter [Trichoderma arundinaceum]|uniref:Major facilitator superfamily transporter n=1 Tax=Trichoderma arundinaceum TaxID=490622 RepID=A0A395NDF7_TRIAR|nr:major facilitator superfamily transporter [Trichoderma arundinaceum]